MKRFLLNHQLNQGKKCVIVLHNVCVKIEPCCILDDCTCVFITRPFFGIILLCLCKLFSIHTRLDCTNDFIVYALCESVQQQSLATTFVIRDNIEKIDATFLDYEHLRPQLESVEKEYRN
jgi:hypothetical protein